MPSTYTLNNGIELIGTGEQSGTWGDTTNTNLGLLDAALDGQVTITLAAAGSSGSPNALPITDGTTSNGRNRMVVFADGADLGATAYVQLTPNDAEKIIYIRNSLSGSRSVILFQGTYNASNDYEVPAGTTAVVYFDGAGAGAVAANVFNNAHFDALNVVGAASIGSLVIAGTAVTATAAELNLLDGSIAGTVVNSKAVIYGAAGQVEATTVEFDNLSGTGAVSVTNILDEDNMASDSATALATQQSIKAYVDAQVGTVDTLAEILAIGNTTGGTDLAVSTGDDITFADSSKAIFGAGSDLQIYHDGLHSYISDQGTGRLKIFATDLEINNAGNTANYIQAFDGGAVQLFHNNSTKLATTATGIDVTGTVAAGAGTALLPSITTTGDLNTGMWFPAADTIAFSEGGVEALRINSSGNVGIGTSTSVANSKLNVTQGITARNDGASVNPYFQSYNANAGADLKTWRFGGGNSGDLIFQTVNDAYSVAATKVTITSSGSVGIGTTSPAGKLHVSGGRSFFAPVSEPFAVGVRYSEAGGSFYFGAASASATPDAVFCQAGGSEKMRITDAGELLVGTTDATKGALTVGKAAPSAAYGQICAFSPTAADTDISGMSIVKYANNSTTAQVLMRFLINQGGAGQGQINANGANTAAFGSYSDSRLKENIVDLPSQLDSIMALRPVEYDYIESMGGGHQIGFVAQEVQAIYPDLVGEDAEGMLTLTDMNKNDARLIKAIPALEG
jgi:hypothetical protein